MEEAERLIDRGIHPIKIADGFDLACKKVYFFRDYYFDSDISLSVLLNLCRFQALETLDNISDTFPVQDRERLVETAETSLGSKMYLL